MAIYHLSAQVIGRSAGRSVVAAAAYRAGERLVDERTGLTHDFTRRRGEIEGEIIAPAGAPEWVYNRARLWNAVEAAEKRKDAQVCREINVALPHELTPDEQRTVLHQYVLEQFVQRGMVADVTIHRDKGNPHGHMMLTSRQIGPDGLGAKVREWNDRALLEQWREAWTAHANRALARAGHQEEIDHRTLVAQGRGDRLPQIHVGPHAAAMERKGIRTERSESLRHIRQRNGVVIDLEKAREERAALRVEVAQQSEIRSLAPGRIDVGVDHLRRLPAYAEAERHLGREIDPGELETLLADAYRRVHEARQEAGLIRSEGERLQRADDALGTQDRLKQRIEALERPGARVGRLLSPRGRVQNAALKDELRQVGQHLRNLGEAADRSEYRRQMQIWEARRAHLPQLRDLEQEAHQAVNILSGAMEVIRGILGQRTGQQRQRQQRGKEIELGHERD